MKGSEEVPAAGVGSGVPDEPDVAPTLPASPEAFSRMDSKLAHAASFGEDSSEARVSKAGGQSKKGL